MAFPFPRTPTDYSPSLTATGTPSNGGRFTAKNAIASFENLVALANHQERLKEARKMVWRDKGQQAVQLSDLWECLEHAGRGGLRAGTLAFNIRASVNLVLALIRLRRIPSHARSSLIRHAILGPDTFRFAAMIGTFTTVYKFIINALPILLPTLNPHPSTPRSPFPKDDIDGRSRYGLASNSLSESPTVVKMPSSQPDAHLSLSAHAQLVLVRKKTRKWHAALAGAVAGGLAIMFETKSRRSVIGQQLFVRGLQGSWNVFTEKHNIRIPYGDVLVFSLACGQIMYGFFIRPDTLPRSYSVWIGQASKIPPPALSMNHDLLQRSVFKLSDMNKVLAHSDITPNNHTVLSSLMALAQSPTPSYGPPYASCSAVHPCIDSCMAVPFDRFLIVFKWMLPIYGALHFVPAMLFKWKAFKEDPGRMAMKSLWGTTRSSAFLGVFVSLYQSVWCFKHYLHGSLTPRDTPGPAIKLPQPFIDFFISKSSYWVTGLITGLSLFVEEKRRRGELAMYVLPKGLESAWVMARGKGLVCGTGQYGEMILTAIGMSMVMSTYQNDPQHLSGLVRRILYQFIGPN